MTSSLIAGSTPGTTRFIVGSRDALADYIGWLGGYAEPWPTEDGPLSEDTYCVHVGSDLFLLRRDESADRQLLLIAADPIERVFRNDGAAMCERLLARVDRVARSIANPPLILPPQWRSFQHNNFVSYFALPRTSSNRSERWIAEILDDRNVCFWKLTSRDAETQLVEFSSSADRISNVMSAYHEKYSSRHSIVPVPASPLAARLQSLVDLSVVGAASVTRGKTYSSWLEQLTDEQRRVLAHDVHEPLKVRGPAGSGKTLVLELKALREASKNEDLVQPVRTLYVTHSWSLAQQVDEAIHSMDEWGHAARWIDVLPLVALRELIHGPLPEGVDLLGEDSLEGKTEQLALISESVDLVKNSDWPTYRDVPPAVTRGVEAEAGTPDRLRLCFDLMREFIEVMDPNQIKPGVNSLARYLELVRQPWMVDLPTKGSREFAFGVYREYVARLVEEGQLTTDQVLDDFRRYLESYTWNLRREEEGYDLILVDEFHLFNDTERHILHLLTNDPDAFPRLIMAMDPRQSAFALLTGLIGERSGDAKLPGFSVEESGSVNLTATHRFAPSVHEFVCYLHKSFPNLVSLGEDWDIDVGGSSRADAADQPVEVKYFKNPESLVEYAMKMALVQHAKGGPDERIAVIGVGSEDLEFLTRRLESGDTRLPVTIIQSRDDVELLQYSKRNVVVTAAEFAAGLQFSGVVVVSTSSMADAGWSSSSGRVTLSQLYLAATRAQDYLLVTSIIGEEGVPNFLRGAIESGVAKSA